MLFYRIIIFIFISVKLLAQTLDSVQIIRSFQIGAGRSISTIALQENNYDVEFVKGWDFNANYLFKDLSRVEFQYCRYSPIDILPIWKQAHLENFNWNYHYIISNEDGSFFIYPNVGIAYTKFRSFQVMDKNFNTINAVKTYFQWGFNMGGGAEFHIRFFSIFVNYNMRVTKITADNTPNVRNVSFSAGIRLFYFKMFWKKEKVNDIDNPEVKKNKINIPKSKHKKRKRRVLFDRLHDRYLWF